MISVEQLQNIANLIIDLGATAEAKNQISHEEGKAIVEFTSMCVAMRRVFDGMGVK